MPDIKLRDGAGVEQTYTGIDTITVPLADGSGNYTYGLTDEELTFSDVKYLINAATTPFLKSQLKRFKLTPILNGGKYAYNLRNMVTSATIDNLEDITIDCTGIDLIYVAYLIDKSNTKTLPTIVNASNLGISNSVLINNPNYLVTEIAILSFLNNFTYQVQDAGVGGISANQTCTPTSNLMANCLDMSDCLKKWHEIINNSQSYANYSSHPQYDLTFPYVKHFKNIPVPYRSAQTTATSDLRVLGYAPNYFMTDSVTFATDNGTAYSIKWKSQVLGLNQKIGYGFGAWNSNLLTHGQGYWKEKNNVWYNATTLEQAQENYAKLKTQDDWWAGTNVRVSYNGVSNIYGDALFSRYNHDSAVETLNSLPDTSEYLASAGGTNTVKFYGIQGALTDGGAINTLTEEEIAVATAKGWTVTFV